MNILVVVDMQNDFIDGSLGTEEAQRIVPDKLFRELMELCLRQEIPMKRTIWRRQKEKNFRSDIVSVEQKAGRSDRRSQIF